MSLQETQPLEKELELSLNFMRGNEETPYPESRVNPGSGTIRINARTLLQLAHSIPRVQDYPFAFVTRSQRHGYRVWGYNTVDVSMYSSSSEKLSMVILPLLRRQADAQSMPGKLPYTVSEFVRRNGQPPLLAYSPGDRFTKFTLIETEGVPPLDIHDLVVAISMATINLQNHQNSRECFALKIAGNLPANYVTGIVSNTWENLEKDIIHKFPET